MDFDQVLVHIGGFNKYQWITLIMIGLAGIPTGMHTLAIVFLAAFPDHWCQIPELQNLNLTTKQIKEIGIPKDESGSYSSCYMYNPAYYVNASYEQFLNVSDRNWTDLVKCSSWHYDRSQYTSTIVSEWNLVCGQRWRVSLAQSFYMIGFLVGAVSFGGFADRFGRKPTHAIAIFMMTVSGTVAAFAPDYWTFVILRCISAMCGAGSFTVGFVITMEVISPARRIIPGIFYQGWFALGYMLNGVIAYFIRDYFTFQLVLSIPPIIFISYYWLLWESPRWLMSQYRFDEGLKLIQKIAKMNGKTITPQMLSEAQSYFKVAADEKRERKQRGGLLDLIKTPNMRKKSLNVFYNWFVNALVYYGLSLGVSELAGNVYVNTVVSGIMEFPGYIICVFFMSRVGRRWPLAGELIFGGVVCLVVIFVPKDYAIITTVLSMIGKVLISGSFALIYVFSAELFPTVIRNVGVGAGSMSARVGSLLSPFMAELKILWIHLPNLVFAVVAITAGLLTFLLPETLNQRLPETLEDGENFGKKPYPAVEMYEKNIGKVDEEEREALANGHADV